MDLLATTDLLREDVHFRRAWNRWEELGWKAAATGLSDVAAMGGRPRAALVSLELPPGVPVRWVDAWYRGLGRALSPHGAAIAGGNVARSPRGITIEVTVLGEVERGRALLRSGGRAGDALWVTGWPGRAAAGLALLERARGRVDADARPLGGAFLRPVPRLREVRWLRARAPLHAAIDLSDGLSGDLGHLAAASRLGAVVEVSRLPRPAALERAAARLHRDPRVWQVHGGEDYELLLAAPPGALERLADAFRRRFRIPLTRIGSLERRRGIRWLGGGGIARARVSFRHFG
jgi:thiamine-monophosphate kinase